MDRVRNLFKITQMVNTGAGTLSRSVCWHGLLYLKVLFLMLFICIKIFHKRIYVMTEVSVLFDWIVADVGTILLGLR